MISGLILLFIGILSCISALSVIPGSDIRTPDEFSLIKEGKFGSKLYSVNTLNSSYANTPYVLDIHAPNAYMSGFDAGYLTSEMIVANYQSLMIALFGDNWYEPVAAELLGLFLDWQWDDYLSKQVPQDYMDEISGLTAGGRAAGELKHDLGKLSTRGIVLANFPGDIQHISIILKEELNKLPAGHHLPMSMDQLQGLFKRMGKRWQGLSCSMFGTWGSRTENGRLFSGRNLDWFKDTGISTYKLVTIYHPLKGFAHATFGWAGIWGSITGISSQGITVHEANLESDDVTFEGFPWVLRLRYIMASAKTISEATDLWLATNNTEGYNHGIGSAHDQKFICLETMKGNTAIFSANDPREQTLIVGGKNIGSPRDEAVYRTNHGYDAYTIAHYNEGDSSYQNSINRYLAFPEAFDSYQAAGTKITYAQAVNITAIIASKGSNFYECVTPFDGGSNILSVAYDPSNLLAYAAWESGAGDSWAPAACSTYLALDLSSWFARKA
jgi:hypothetical protein